jgi:hypothetical protein
MAEQSVSPLHTLHSSPLDTPRQHARVSFRRRLKPPTAPRATKSLWTRPPRGLDAVAPAPRPHSNLTRISHDLGGRRGLASAAQEGGKNEKGARPRLTRRKTGRRTTKGASGASDTIQTTATSVGSIKPLWETPCLPASNTIGGEIASALFHQRSCAFAPGNPGLGSARAANVHTPMHATRDRPTRARSWARGCAAPGGSAPSRKQSLSESSCLLHESHKHNCGTKYKCLAIPTEARGPKRKVGRAPCRACCLPQSIQPPG